MQLFTKSLRPAQAAALLGVSKSTLLRWERQRPDMPRPRRYSDRLTIYDRDELIAWRDTHAKGVAA
ncbi:hypothetical protein LJR099_003948 [Variovorax paradoxus]